MRPLDFRKLKQTSEDLLVPYQRSAGRAAVGFILVFRLLLLLFDVISGYFIELPAYQTTEELLQYFKDGHIDTLIKILGYEFAVVGCTMLFAGVFSGYCLRISKGQPATAKTLLGCTKLVFRYLLLFIMLLAAAFVLIFVFSLVAVLLAPLSVLLVVVMFIAAFVIFYMLRLLLFAVADRSSCSIPAAIKESIRITKGHKKELFFLDISFLWFSILVSLISSVLTFLPDAAANVAEKLGNTALPAWVDANYFVLSLVAALIGLIAVLPIYYKFYTKIQTTYALAYQSLKEQQAPEQEDTQPLAYMEFSGPQDEP